MATFVVKTADRFGVPVDGVFDELKAGRARIGWSYDDKLDLRKIKRKLKAGAPLDADEVGAKRCLGFLTRVEKGDTLIYPHQPARGQFAVVEVTGDYEYSDKDNAISGDFRSVRSCTFKTSASMHDDSVPSQLSFSMKKRGRFYRVYDTRPLNEFLDPEAGATPLKRIYKQIREKIREILPDAIRRQYSQQDLSRKFLPVLFEHMGYSSDVQEGPSEAGSDLVVSLDSPLLPETKEIRIGVQAFAYEGVVKTENLQGKLDQLLAGWEQNKLDYGVLLTTGSCGENGQDLVADHNKQTPHRQVRLIDGPELADLFRKYMKQSMGGTLQRTDLTAAAFGGGR